MDKITAEHFTEMFPELDQNKTFQTEPAKRNRTDSFGRVQII